MSVVSSPIQHSIAQVVQAQQVASKAREKEKAESANGRRFNDLVELRVSGAQTADAVRQLPSNDSEQSDTERHSHQSPGSPESSDSPDEHPRPRIDVKA